MCILIICHYGLLHITKVAIEELETKISYKLLYIYYIGGKKRDSLLTLKLFIVATSQSYKILRNYTAKVVYRFGLIQLLFV